jgi:branched-chain amino acid transport system ATP-binding protein
MSEAILTARSLSAGYFGHAFVQDLDLEIRRGEVVALIGPNGAGKTTTLLALAGELPLLGGSIDFAGIAASAPLHQRARAGLAFVTEERSVFMRMTVADNLRLGGCDLDTAFDLFPPLKPLAGRLAGLLSGGEQQMLTLGRALTRDISVLLIDELSLGLAPLIVARLLEAVRAAATEKGIGVLLVEQQVEAALAVSDRAYVLRRGSVALSGDSREISERVRELEVSYLAEKESAPASGTPAEAGGA